MSEPNRLGPNTVLARSPDILASDMDGETVMLAISSGRYYSLDPVGSAVWEALEEPRTWADLVAHLVDHFEVGEERCRAETEDFLAEMLAEGILLIHEPAA